MDITFHNVMITISASSPREAYDKLADMLNSIDVLYTTDTYSVDCSEDEKSTTELFPKD